MDQDTLRSSVQSFLAVYPDGSALLASNSLLTPVRGLVGHRDAALLAQVRTPLLAVLHTSPDFRPAYDPLLRMADSLARTDPPAALALLADLVQAPPARPDAALALRQLDAAAR